MTGNIISPMLVSLNGACGTASWYSGWERALNGFIAVDSACAAIDEEHHQVLACHDAYNGTIMC